MAGTFFLGSRNGNDAFASNEQSYLVAIAVGATVVFVLMLVGVVLLHFYRQRIHRQHGHVGRIVGGDDQTVKTDAEEQDDPLFYSDGEISNHDRHYANAVNF